MACRHFHSGYNPDHSDNNPDNLDNPYRCNCRVENEVQKLLMPDLFCKLHQNFHLCFYLLLLHIYRHLRTVGKVGCYCWIYSGKKIDKKKLKMKKKNFNKVKLINIVWWAENIKFELAFIEEFKKFKLRLLINSAWVIVIKLHNLNKAGKSPVKFFFWILFHRG